MPAGARFQKKILNFSSLLNFALRTSDTLCIALERTWFFNKNHNTILIEIIFRLLLSFTVTLLLFDFTTMVICSDFTDIVEIESKMIRERNVDGSNSGRWICSVCGYTTTNSTTLKRHIESKHLSVSYDCDLCGQRVPSKHALVMHKKRRHLT